MKKDQIQTLPPLSVTLSLEEYQGLLDRLRLSEQKDLEYVQKILENEQTIRAKEQEILDKKQEILAKEQEIYEKKQEAFESKLELIEAQEEIDRLRWKLVCLNRFCWGSSSEKRRLPLDPSQLSICFVQSPQNVNIEQEKQKEQKEIEKDKEYSRFRKSFKEKKISHARKPIPSELPRISKVLEPSVDLSGAIRMGEEVTERYAVQPRKLYVEQLVRPRYKLPDGSIVIAPLPTMAYPRSNASESALTHIAVSKYADHLPLNRQIEIFSREGVHLSASTVSNWMTATAQCIEPIYNELRETLKASRYVQADETPHKVLESEKPGSLHQGYMWVFYLPHCKSPYIEYHPGRSSSALGTLLSGKTEIVQSDGYAVYDVFDKLEGKMHLCCWAHVRRKFVEVEKSTGKKAKGGTAHAVLDLIGQHARARRAKTAGQGHVLVRRDDEGTRQPESLHQPPRDRGARICQRADADIDDAAVPRVLQIFHDGRPRHVQPVGDFALRHLVGIIKPRRPHHGIVEFDRNCACGVHVCPWPALGEPPPVSQG